MPISVRRAQMFSWPARHSLQVPHDSIGFTATRRPTHSSAPPPAPPPPPPGPPPRRRHRARELVADDERRRAVAHVPEIALDLRAADPDRFGREDQLARSRIGRVVVLLDRPLVRALPDDRLHTPSTVFTNSPSPVMAIRTSSPARSVNSTAGITDVPVSSTAPTGKS